jgi:hypothetical protein
MSHPARLTATVETVRAAGFPVRASEIPGLSRGRVRAAVTAGALLCPRRGIVLPAADWAEAGPSQRHRWAVQSALLAYPGSWASHTSATQLHGVTTLAPRPVNGVPMVHISRPGVTLQEPTLVVHGQVSPPEQVGVVQGVPCSTLIRATIEVAARRSLTHAVAVIDAGMRASLACHVDLRQAALDEGLRASALEAWDAAVAPYARHRWVTIVRQAIRVADPAAESFLESISRVAMIEGGLPLPRCGVPMLGDDGRTYWLDFWWDEAGVIGEADGLGKYRDRDDLLAEKYRQEALQPRAQAVVRWGMAQVVPDPRPMLERLRQALSPTRGMGWSR